jgi:hypothetical protein
MLSFTHCARINPFKPITLEALGEQLQGKGELVEVQEVDWLPGFYRVDASVKIASLDAYKAGTFLAYLCLILFPLLEHGQPNDDKFHLKLEFVPT